VSFFYRYTYGQFAQWVMAELCHRAATLGAGYSVSSWRTAGGAEVDVILHTPEEVIPVEIKWAEGPRPPDARNVETFIRPPPPGTQGLGDLPLAHSPSPLSASRSPAVE